ncbi:chemotaxis protein MotB [Anaerobacterium chartisolvens]|uniref:Chemotaxis protein MotB n=1 Tax=Anaerobacterium chartisolvens TaxID=1297424 RepID=A0A369ADY0_9FIRM|nr:flagellar motor protein MotB [Anaerobacterium chartisolvens]RCX07305.1 chemotaxis protein MotB [Anaerobacterium chartisolvens]
MSNKKKIHHEEHVDETWLIPYADMLTLLLALFIVMFAMGQTNKEKLHQISDQFNIIFSGGSGFFEKDGQSLVPHLNHGGSLSPQLVEADKMNEIKSMLDKEIEQEGHSDKISLVLNDEGLEISIQDTVLFEPGDATILDKASPMLNFVAKVLSTIDNKVRITGHTDNIPIKNRQFRSNWDLSAIRAINAMEFLIDTGGIEPNRFLIQGNGEYSPKFDNSTESGRAKNRRIEVSIIRKYPLDE